jgi:ferric-dicitrate binding protein FerR (iron transport regulator)
MDNSELARLLKRLKNGTITDDERELLERQWNNALNDNSGLDVLPADERDVLKKNIYGNISRKLGFKKREHRIPAYVYKIAASLLLLFVFSTAWYLSERITDAAVEAPTAFVEIETKYGERLTIKLPDESSVVLNGNSRLKYSKHWSSSSPREVWIDGEGFFAVEHTINHQKFIVHTREGLNVEVLGTKFNVKSREHASEVLLTEGKVKLNVDSDAEPAVILKPGEMATMKENKLSKRAVEDKQYTSWVRSKLYFDKMTLEELAQILKETYGVEVSFQNDQLKKRQLSGEISSATVDDILFAVAQTFNIEVTRESDNHVIFSSRN